MTVLADTSVWIAHLRQGEPALSRLLNDGLIQMHPFVLGELACGNLNRRAEILSYLATLPEAPRARDSEVMNLLELRKLWGQGLGWIDAHLLASALIARTALWTLDRRLNEAASRLELNWPPS